MTFECCVSSEAPAKWAATAGRMLAPGQTEVNSSGEFLKGKETALGLAGAAARPGAGAVGFTGM